MRQVFRWMIGVLLCCGCAAGPKLGETQPDALLLEAQSDFDEATKLKGAARYSEALVQAQHALTLREAVLVATHPDIASCLTLMGELQVRQGEMDAAESLLKRALAIREAALRPGHPDVAEPLHQLALLYRLQGLFDQARPLYQRALAIREAALGPNHPDVAQSLNGLADLYENQGLYGQAEPLYQRALAIREAALDPNHPDVASSLNNLAILYMDLGLPSQAEPLYQRARAILEGRLGKSHPHVAVILSNLGGIYLHQGLYGRAEPILQRALAIRESVLGVNHPDVAEILFNLGNLYKRQGLYSRAEPLYQRSLSIVEKVLGPSHPFFANSLNNLANLYTVQGLYGQAEPLYQRALSIQEAALGSSHTDVASSLNNLANLYTAQGLYDRAEPLYQRALSIREAVLGKSHPNVAMTLGNIALLRVKQQRLPEALLLYTRALTISEQRLRHEALDFSESRLATFLQYLRDDEQTLYSLLRAHSSDARVQRLALSASLLLKGRSVEETARISRALYRTLDSKDRETFEQLRSLRTQLAALSFEGSGGLSPEDYQLRLKALADEGDALEAALATRSASLRAFAALPPTADIVDRVAASLPKDGALVEFIAYEDMSIDFLTGTLPATSVGQPRYLALVLFPDASTRALDLGPAERIDVAATRLRAALANRDASFQPLAQELYRLAFKPLLPLLGRTRRLWLSPDGQLGLVPFAALHDGRSYLLDSFDFTWLTSGRELLPRPPGFSPSSSVVVLADPDFTAAPPATALASGDLRLSPSTRSGALERFFSTVDRALPGSDWVPLPGTRQEAQGIQRLLPQAQLFLGPEATKQRLLELPAPGILHLATHGFFLADTPAVSPANSRAVVHFGALGDDPLAPIPRDPLLRSGLAFAGARAVASEASAPSESSAHATIATALELAGLDLWGTQLVVLSACDTARGDVQPGQGVYGLRRALVVAGAETVVMSLWKVRDDSTHLLMRDYYRNLLAGQGRASALREAMRSLRASRPHPHDWAPFIVLGSGAPLRAISPQAPQAPGR
ncbi:CHAT domain-containing tetratricopeptide repeat protein [Hyalangium minutum]|uniref:CHAT domain-containing protein n=1 Tax=Hyalangium minutum TaxID=394096 RepID=A0A085W7S0_9BACT|nr:CHAT domain-containing tetratricopeptide repeat protein [Hyalangium minutum]KFE63733.1 hypothetical protein DB31_2501 [Hyalangium minutum]